MKALYASIIPALLAGCNNLMLEQTVNSDLSKSELVTTTPSDKNVVVADKNSADKTKSLLPVHVDTLPPLSPTAPPKIPIVPPTPAIVAPIIPLISKPLPDFKILKVGSRGKAVLALEKRLNELDYEVGKVDGYYDKQTKQGVFAFQKYSNLKRTGTYTEETDEVLQTAKSPEGLHPELGLPRIEIDITRQVLLYFDKKGLNRVIAVSSGSNKKYCEKSKKSGKKMCGEALTPRGEFHIQWKIAGERESDLGTLYNPLYFSGGFAIHGSPSVPGYNASHGCVRISIATSKWFYSAIKMGTPVILFD